MMKGQMVFEFLVACIFFFGIVLYVIMYMNTTVAVFTSEFVANSMEEKALGVSELLVHHRGLWHNQEPVYIGLELDWPVMNRSKIEWLDVYCASDYDELKGLLGMREFRVRIGITELVTSPTTILQCGPDIPPGFPSTTVNRYALDEDGDVLKVSVWVW